MNENTIMEEEIMKKIISILLAIISLFTMVNTISANEQTSGEQKVFGYVMT